MEYTTSSYEETVAMAKEFAKSLEPASVLYLSGELGAGKTAFCCGLAKGLGSIDEPSSPTYSIVNYYRGDIPFAHFDVYRISSEEDLETTGFFEYLSQGAVIAVEWYENLIDYLDKPNYYIRIDKVDDNTRTIVIEKAEE